MLFPKRDYTAKTQEDGSTLVKLLLDDAEHHTKTFKPADYSGSRSKANDAAKAYGNMWVNGKD